MTGKEAPYFNQIGNHLQIQMKAKKRKKLRIFVVIDTLDDLNRRVPERFHHCIHNFFR
jgi:hypothetical protein